MKTNIKLLFLIIAIFSLSSQLYSQAFEKGNWNIDLDLGFGAYGTKSTSTITVGAFSVTDTDVDGTASSVFRLGGEYGISDRIGLGLKLGSSNYFIAEEDRDTVKSVKGTDFAVSFNFHLLKANRNDLFLTLGLGFSSAKWLYHDVPGFFLSSAKGSGSYLTLGITDRIFFSDHVGMLLNISYAGFNCNSITPELSSTGKAIVGNVNYTWNLDIILRGVYFGTGLAIKF
ncbi:MAG TPA: hypothetical protein PK833_05900 [Vicingus sp.]|nr:hypothetical protein [Vicingus sp.]